MYIHTLAALSPPAFYSLIIHLLKLTVMNAMKICLIFFVTLLAVAETNAQVKPGLVPNGSSFDQQSTLNQSKTLVYPNPFRSRFLIRPSGEIDLIQLFDDKGDEVYIEYTQRHTTWIVVAKKAEPGDYMVVITYSNGSQESIPISKL